jgi:curli biogenesis system outer membrane secretion channel CsgG
MKTSLIVVFAVAAFVSACATPAPEPTRYSPPVGAFEAEAAREAALLPEQPTLRRRVAVGRFSNATNYGRALLRPGERDPLADQVADMLMSRLVETDRFIVVERADLDVIAAEQRITGADSSSLIGVDAIIVGSVNEFGRRTEGQAGFLSSTMRQAVDARVSIRLVDVDTGVAFFSADGQGSATNEAGEVAGFGSRAGYDGTLNDRAISAAIDDLVNNIIIELSDRPWRTDVLEARGQQVFIAGGERMGIRTGDVFELVTRGETITSRTTGLPITLPGEAVATVRIISFFGDSELSEGSIAEVISGHLPINSDLSELDVREVSQ